MVIEKTEEDGLIEWSHQAAEPEIFGVSASQEEDDEYWAVFVSAAEFVREEPLESKLRSAVASALASVPNVTSVEEEDREVWVVEGDVNGKELVASTVAALKSIYPELKAYLDAF